MEALPVWHDDGGHQAVEDGADQTGLSQQAPIAAGINCVLAKYGKPAVAS